MSIKKVCAVTLAFLAIGSSKAWGQCDAFTTSTIRNCNGIDYELWSQNNKGNVKMEITGGSTNPNGGTFKATWSGTENVLFRAGKKWGQQSTTTAKMIGNITLEFEATWSSGDNVKMLGVYGWAFYPQGSQPQNFSNQIEYYIIQDRGSYNAASGGTNAQKKGEGTIDDILYEFWVCDRINQPMLTGNGNFKQYFSVPKNTSSHRTKGTISVSKHFDAWDKAGMKMMDCPLYEVAMKVESYTGSPNGYGNADVTKNLLTLGGSSGGDEFTLVTNVSPTGAGTVTRNPNNSYYAKGSSVQLTATPNTGYKFVGWEGDASGSTSPVTVTMNKDLTVTAKFQLVSGDGTVNLLKDGDFPSSSVISTDDNSSWKLGQGQYWGNSAASSSVSNGTAAINVTTTGTEAYQPQLVQYGLALDEGVMYKLTFKARASAARKIQVSFQMATDPYTTYAEKEFDLTTTDQEYQFVFTMSSASDPSSQFAFNLGQATGTVYISDVKLVHTATSIHRGYSPVATHGSMPLISVKGRTLNVAPVDGSKLQVRVLDVNGKVVASFNTTDAAAYSLSNISAGRYFVYVSGMGVKQFTPITLK